MDRGNFRAMVGARDAGVRITVGLCLLTWVFVACGGESESSGGGGDGDDRGGTSSSSGSGGSGATNGGSSIGGSSIGGSSIGGASIGGSSIGGSSIGGSAGARGGSGPVDPIDPPGPSFCGGEPCDAPLACCLATGQCYDPATEGARGCAVPPPDDDQQGRTPCASSAQCEPNEFCMTEGPLCVGTGHCQPIDNCGSCGGGDPAAPDNPCRVCGCDGNTYPNVQTACRAGVNAVGPGGSGCGEMNTEGGAGSSSIGPRPYTTCGHDAQCPAGSFCCTLNARCYVEADRDICVLPPPGTRIACKTSENCGDNEYCRGEGCDEPGGCVFMGSGPGDCGVTLEPVCGCNGTTYTSAACADQEGIRVDHDGECD